MRFLTLSLAIVAAGCGDGDSTTPLGPTTVDMDPVGGTVSYAEDVRAIIAVKCTRCHFEGAPERVNLENPFDAERGVVGLPDPSDDTRILVVPYMPEESFLIDKITRTDLDPDTEGERMPRQIAPLTASELTALWSWIASGAHNDDSFVPVKKIFDDKCHDCHNAAAAIAPNIDKPWDETGVCDVPAGVPAGGDDFRVDVGHPETSLLYTKVSGQPLPTELGEPMPLHIAPLTAQEVDLITRWVAEGALDN